MKCIHIFSYALYHFTLTYIIISVLNLIESSSFLFFLFFCFIMQALWLGLKAFLVALECRSGSYTSIIRFLKNEIRTVEIKLSGLESEY